MLQQELVHFLEDSVRFFGCQLLIATHSPFLLAMKGAKIYDLDADPVKEEPLGSIFPPCGYTMIFLRRMRKILNKIYLDTRSI